jgi:hypothetical protein
MSLQPSRFSLDEELSVAGKPARVAGRLQLEADDGRIATRYFVAGTLGTAHILEETGDGLAMLRPLPSAAQQAAGKTVTVLGSKYALAGIRRLKVLGVEGQPPQAVPGAQLLLSGVFEGPSGRLLRELVPGTSVQMFFGVEPLAADEVLGAPELAARREAERLAAAQQAEAESESDPAGSGRSLMKAAGWLGVALVVGGLFYACSEPARAAPPPVAASAEARA